MAQALEIAPVGEHRPIPLVIPDVVHVGGGSAQAPPGTLSAERLAEQLAGTEIVRPHRQAVPPMPGGGLPTGRLPGLMIRTPAVPGQRRASWVTARAQRFLCHGLSPPSKTKSARATTQPPWVGYGLWRLTLWPLSIFKITSLRQVRQYTGKPVASVSELIRSRWWFRLHTGQTTHPSFTVSVPCFPGFCNTFPSTFTYSV